MRLVKGNIFLIALVLFLMVQGCSARPEVSGVKPLAWEPGSIDMPPPPEIGKGENAPLTAASTAPFGASEFAMELSKLSSRAAEEIARLKTEAMVDSEFPSDAASLLQSTAEEMRQAAETGNRSAEAQLTEDYLDYVGEAGKLEDTIVLGESMEYVLGRDIVAYHQLNSSDIADLKKAFWRKELDKLSLQLSEEHSKFLLVKEARLIARDAAVGSGQSTLVASLEADLQALAADYAARISAAIEAAAQETGIKTSISTFTGAGMGDDAARFEEGFASKVDDVRTVTGDE